MERSEKELRPYAEHFLEVLEHWCDIDLYSVNHYVRTCELQDIFETDKELTDYTEGLRRILEENRLDVMKDRVGALEFGEEVFRDGLVDTENGVYLASVMREARRVLEAEIYVLTNKLG